jgi:uncharacterized protein (DUF927 family)
MANEAPLQLRMSAYTFPNLYREIGSILDNSSKQHTHNRNLEIATADSPIKTEVSGRRGQVRVCD